MAYHIWFLRYGARQTEFFVILDYFSPFTTAPLPPNNPKNQNLEIIKIAPGEIIILQNSTTNGNHMMYGSSDMERIVGIY